MATSNGAQSSAVPVSALPLANARGMIDRTGAHGRPRAPFAGADVRSVDSGGTARSSDRRRGV